MREGNIMMTIGGDFRWYNANLAYKNWDKLIYHVNRLHGDKVNVMYSTPACYTKARHESNLTWTVKTDDFMPYTDAAGGKYETGYFTSRPGFKGYVWDTNPVLQMCHQLNLRSSIDGDDAEFELARAFGVAQHHDGISGTERQHVVDDYSKSLASGRHACQNFSTLALNELYGTPQEAIVCEYLNVTICNATVDALDFTIGIYSPASHSFSQPVVIPVNNSNYYVTDGTNNPVLFDIILVSDVTKNIRRNRGQSKYELRFLANTKPFDLVTYNLKVKNSGSNVRPTVRKNQTDWITTLSNEHLNLTFNEAGLVSINDLPVQNQLMYFNSSQGYGQNSGAYIFRPNSSEPIEINAKPEIFITYGQSYRSAIVSWDKWASQEYKLWNGAPYVEVEWSVGPIPINDTCSWNSTGCHWGKEVISRYTSAINNTDGAKRYVELSSVVSDCTILQYIFRPVCYTDSSGRNTLKRVKDFRPTWKINTEEAETAVAGNYYPINSRIGINGSTLTSNNASLTILGK